MAFWAPRDFEDLDADGPLDLTAVKEETKPYKDATARDNYEFCQEYRPWIQPGVIRPTAVMPPLPVVPVYQYCPVPTWQISPASAVSTSASDHEEHKSPPPHRSSTSSPHYLEDDDALSDDPDYQAFEKEHLRAMAEKNGGLLLNNNPRMRRAVQTQATADDSYRKQRERNNFAAKQSRDRRKLREIRSSLKISYLKKKMTQLKLQLAAASYCAGCRRGAC